MTIKQAIDILLAEIKIEQSPTSWHNYQWLARTTEEYWGPNASLDSITRFQVQSFVNHRRPKVAASTVRAEVSFLNRLFRVAMDRCILMVSPISKIRMPKVNNRRERILLPDEELALAQELGPQRWSVVLFAIHTAMRRKEQFSLKTQDLTLWRDGEEWQGMAFVVTSKTGKGRRTPLNPIAARIAYEWSKRQAEYLFGGQGTDRLSVGQYYSSLLKEACERRGIRGFRWHDLRHTCASRSLQGGARLEQVQALLGHASVTQTERYCHWAEDHVWPAAMALLKPPARIHAHTSSCNFLTGPGQSQLQVLE